MYACIYVLQTLQYQCNHFQWPLNRLESYSRHLHIGKWEENFMLTFNPFMFELENTLFSDKK